MILFLKRLMAYIIIVKFLTKIAPGLSDRFPIEAAVWFSTCEIKNKMPNFPLKYREASGAVLGDEDFAKKGQAIYNVFEFYGSRVKRQILQTRNMLKS